MATEQDTEHFWIGFDLGGTKMLAALLDGRFSVVDTERTRTRPQEGADAGLARIEQAIRALLDRNGIAPERLRGIGLGSPGPLDLNRGVILDTPNLGWKDVPLREYLEKRFPCPVTVANDVDAGTFGEYRHGAGRKARSMLGVFIGTGIGGGFVYDGRILRGDRLSCIEIGHMRIRPEGPRCGCGQQGCLEAVASRLAIAAEAARAACRGEAPALFAKTGCDLSQIRSGAISRAIRKGDRAVEDIVRHAARDVGAAVAGVVNLLAPDAVVLGGGMVEAIPDLWVEECGKTAAASVMPSFVGTFRVAAAKLGDHAGVIGAAALAAEPEAM